jgi:hypothetical protein
MNLPNFSAEKYGAAVSPLLEGVTRLELSPSQSSSERRGPLQGLTPEDLGGGRTLRDRSAAQACLSGLWLLHGFLDQSHQISQGLPSQDGSYWHGLMHRAEGDYGNAKYWFRQTGTHAIHPLLHQEARRQIESTIPDEAARQSEWGDILTSPAWSPDGFVDRVARVVRAGSPTGAICEKIAWIEWQLLFDHCHQQAFGPPGTA